MKEENKEGRKESRAVVGSYRISQSLESFLCPLLA
jgi:hypothetical protein